MYEQTLLPTAVTNTKCGSPDIVPEGISSEVYLCLRLYQGSSFLSSISLPSFCVGPKPSNTLATSGHTASMAGLDYRMLRQAGPKDWAHHLRALTLDGVVSNTITEEIVDAVSAESLSPHVLSVWITACPDLSAMRAGLGQMVSVSARVAAIKSFGSLFRKGRHAQIWQAVGGAKGVAALMASWSVNEVSIFCRVLGRCSTTGGARRERQELVTELMRALVPSIAAGGVKAGQRDGRPLIAEYTRLVYACTPEFIEEWRGKKETPDLDPMRLVMVDPWLARERCLQEVNTGDVDLSRYMPLFTSVPAAVTTHDKSVSEPSAFALRLIDLLSVKDNLDLPKHSAHLVLETLLKRAARRKTSTTFTATAVNAIACCLRNYRSASNPYRMKYKDHLDDIVRIWHRDPSRFQPDLTQILRFAEPSDGEITTCVSAYRPQTSRYQLLRWLIRDYHQSCVDIDDVNSLRLDRSLRLSSSTVTSLPRQEAVQLLDRLTQARPDGGFLVDNQFGKSPDGDMHFDVMLLIFSLRDDRRAVAEDAKEVMKKCQRHAETSRDQNVRASWAKATLAFAFATEDFVVISETVIWARRYNRDPLTLGTLYGYNGVFTPQAVGFFSGLPQAPQAPKGYPSNELISEQIFKGNKIALEFLETAIMCQREPSFNARFFNGILGLFAAIASVRFTRAPQLQGWLNLNDQAMFDLVSGPTIDMLLQADRQIFDPANRGLQNQLSPAGLLSTGSAVSSCTWSLDDVKEPSRLTLRFFDTFMQRQDELWQELRVAEHPAVSTLTAPWVKGLPIQAFHGMGSAGFAGSQYRRGWLPNLDRRAEAVVFMRGDTAMKSLPDDKDVRAAIGGFIDDYETALAVYLAPTRPEDAGGRSDRISKAWAHALSELSGSRMTALEAELYWRIVFRNAGVDKVPVELPRRPLPALPNSDPSMEIFEWNPDPDPKAGTLDERALEPTCIDVLTSRLPNVYGLSLQTDFPNNLRPVVPGLRQPKFWDIHELQEIKDNKENIEVDAYVTAALLFFEGRAAAGSSILSAPYPNAGEARIPALYLDADFLDRKEHNPDAVLNTLNIYLRDVPPTLLRRLVLALREKLQTRPQNEHFVRRWCFELLKLLAWGDKPQLALDVIADVVVNMREESSWHRELLHQGILKRLPAQQAYMLMTTLRDRVLESLENSAQIKITTVKMLAQMLNGASYLAEGRSVSILIATFERATHLDIRVAIVESLMSMLWNTKDEDIRNVVLEALERHAVPQAGDLNERSPMTEERWREAEEELEPPESYMEGNPRALPPICAAILSSQAESGDADAKETNDVLGTRLTIGIIKRSIETHKRWTSIFLRKHGVEHLAPMLPQVPVRPHMLLDLFKTHPTRMPRVLFEHLSSYILLHQDLPQALVGFNERLTKEDALRNTNEEKQWRSVWGKNALSMQDACVPQVLQQTDWPSEDREGLIRLEDVWTHERKMIDTLLSVYDRYPGMYDDYFKRHCQNPQRSTKEHLKRWQWNNMPMIEYTIERVNSMRTPEWQSNPDRQPAILPGTFPMRLWLLHHPTYQNDADHGEHVVDFAKGIRALVDYELLPDQRPYQERYALVESAAQVGWLKDYLRVAVIVGDVDPDLAQLSLAELLRVRLAKVLVEKAERPDDLRDIDDLKAMLARWRRSMDEDVRRAGLLATKRLESRANVIRHRADDRTLVLVPSPGA